MKRTLHTLALVVLILSAALVLGSAFAQDATTPTSFADLWQELVVPTLLTLASAAIGYLSVLLSGFLKRAAANQENQLVAKALEMVGSMAVTAVAETAQTAVKQLKAAHADGKLTREEAQAALAFAASRVWATLGAQARDTLLKQSGGSVQSAIDTFVKPAVEQQVALLDAVLPQAAPITGEGERERALMLARAKLGLGLQ